MGVFGFCLANHSIAKVWNKHFPQFSVKLTNWEGDGWEKITYNRNAIVGGALLMEVNINNDTEYLLVRNTKPYLYFSLSLMPGCCAYCISHNTYVGDKNKGYGKKLQAVKKEIAKLLGFTAMLCTVTSDNAAEIHILETHGWIKTNTIKNKRTGHVVYTYQYILDQQEEEMI